MLLAHLFRCGLELPLHFFAGQHGIDFLYELVIGPIVAMRLETVARLFDARGVVMAVPNIRHDQRRLAEIETLGEGIVAAMVNDGIDFGDHRRLRKPAVDADIAWNIGVPILVVADVDECPHGHLAEKRYQPLEKIYVAGAERAETHIQQRLAVVALRSEEHTSELQSL